MTEMLNKEFSRKTFVKGGGALVVGFSLVGASLGAKSAKAIFNPDAALVDSWITITPDNIAILKTSQIEVGNGITTGFLQVMAEELDMSMGQVRHSPWDTNILVNSGDQFVIRFRGATDNSVTDVGFALDDVDVRGASVVPEPGTFVAIGIGLAGLALARRRK